MKHAVTFAIVLAAVLATLLSGSAQGQEQGTTAIRLAHLVPAGPVLDVRLDGQVLAAELVPSRVTGYSTMPAGEYRLTLTPLAGTVAPGQPGEVPGGGEPSATEVTVTLEPGDYVTIAIVGRLLSAPEPEAPQAAAQPPAPSVTMEVIRLADVFGELPPAGEASVRVVHASRDASPIEVSARGQGEGSESPQDTMLASDLAAGDATAHLPLAVGAHRLTVRAEGEVASELSDVLLESGFLYTFYVTQDGSVVAVSVDAGVSLEAP